MDAELIGGAGADTLVGGSGADLFRFREIADSPLSDWDILTDFGVAEDDRIDLSAIDANAAAVRR